MGAQDKNQAYDFQLREDVQATLHVERRERFEEDIVASTVPKLIVDRSAIARGQWTLVALGRNLERWGGVRVEGDPTTIVNQAFRKALLEHQMKNQAVDIQNARLIPALRKPLEANDLEAMGIPVLENRRRDRRPNPTSPTGAGSAAVRALIAG